ncbi:MAG: hypothetical protein H6Q67_1267 [Firmicutes bacterium]|nr:hypothetical protein [Bacillota bacterium]
MKKCLLLLLLLMIYTVPVFATDTSDIATSGKAYIDDTMKKVLESYSGVHYNLIYNEPNVNSGTAGFWAKINGYVDPSYQVNITKSETGGYVANVEISFDYLFFQVYLTKEEAEASQEVVQKSVDKFLITLAYNNGQWRATEAKKYDSLLNAWFTLNTSDIFSQLNCKYEKH